MHAWHLDRLNHTMYKWSNNMGDNDSSFNSRNVAVAHQTDHLAFQEHQRSKVDVHEGCVADSKIVDTLRVLFGCQSRVWPMLHERMSPMHWVSPLHPNSHPLACLSRLQQQPAAATFDRLVTLTLTDLARATFFVKTNCKQYRPVKRQC